MKTRVFAVCVVVFLFCGITNAGLSDGLVAYYPFNGNANDESGNGNNGTSIGGVTFTPGKVGQALFLNGTDYVNAGNAPIIHISAGDFTIGVWVFFNAISGDMSIVDKMVNTVGSANNDGWRLLKQTDNRFWFCFGGGTKNGCDSQGLPAFGVFSSTKAMTGVWYHIAVVKSTANFSIYVNGQLQDSRYSLPNFLDTQSPNLLIGNNASYRAYLNGLIDEAKVYNRALSESEIQQLYRGGTCSTDIVTFTAGTPAKAAEVNANFDSLSCQIQALQALKAIVCQDHPTASVCQ